jgi:hypothetical protein
VCHHSWSMKPAEYNEGSDAFTRFREVMQKAIGRRGVEAASHLFIL